MGRRALFFAVFSVFCALLLAMGCSNDDSTSDSGGGDPGWTAYNDCAFSGTEVKVNPNTTAYGLDTDIPGWGSTGGPLKMISDGTDTPVSVELSGDNLRTWNPSAGIDVFNPGTDAYNTFNGMLNPEEIVSYGDGLNDWYFEAVFTGLDPAKEYAFVTTSNRNKEDYEGDGEYSRWTMFTISGADTYTPASSDGVTIDSDDVAKINTGYNTGNGYVVGWTGITAADGSFTVRSGNVGSDGPGVPYQSYGMQCFMFEQLPD